MRPASRRLALVPLLACAAPVPAATELDLAIALFADADGARSLDVDLSVAPARWLTLSAGAGTSDASIDANELGGEAVRAFLDVHSERVGIQPFFRSWSDESDFDSDTVGARAYFRASGFTVSLVGESQDLRVGFSILVLGRPVERSASFTRTGIGAGISWYGETWGGYVEGLTYDYDERFDAVVAASRSPTVTRFPRLQAVVGSVLTLTQGTLDHQVLAGVERAFSRSTLSIDWVGVEDAIDGLRAGSIGGTWTYVFTPAFDMAVTIGVSDSETLDSLAFGGLTFMLHR